jgi:hypothetical protein
MNWYLIPIYKKEEDGQITYVPGYLLNGEVSEFKLPGYVCHAHSPKSDPKSALLGLISPITSLPDGWLSKNVDDAKEYFKTIKGRDPSDREVF